MTQTHTPAPSPRSRIAGCLLGGAIGDALGAPIEFDSLAAIRTRHGAAGINGFLPAYGRTGAITDDTQMTLFTAEGLLRAHAGGTTPAHDAIVDAVRTASLDWYTTQGGGSSTSPGWLVSQPVLHALRAPGNTCLSALRAGGTGTPTRPLNDSKGCGAVMRVAPIGLTARDAFALAVDAGALTHGHPSGYLSAGAFAAVIAELCHGTTLPDAIGSARRSLQAWPNHEETLAAIDAATRAAAAGVSSPERVEQLGGGWVGEEALALALYCALVADDVRSGLLLAVNHSGDSDSTGSIAGNLLGAMHGVEALPTDLLAALEARELIEQVADDLASVFIDGTLPDPDRYPTF